MNPLSLYVHIPFCARKCRYCDFPSWEGLMGEREHYTAALEQEIASRAGGQEAATVFFGGGTPSLLMPGQLRRILRALRDGYRIQRDAEITVEANPGALSDAFLRAAGEEGVNRISLGVQALDDGLLALLGRQHTAAQAVDTVRRVREAGFININIDLMFGLPAQTQALWRDTLQKALALPVTHISCYALIPEEGTPLRADLGRGALSLPDEDAERDMYDAALDMLGKEGFERYEISNFARPGYACRHNIGCWRRYPYHGFGCAAHSLVDTATRLANPADFSEYMQGAAVQAQRLTKREQMFETMMLGLRMREGVSLEAFRASFGCPLEESYGARLAGALAAGLVRFEQGFLRLTDRGMNLENAVLLDLMD